jgi:nicotinamide-nucleotide amidase
VLAHPGQVDIRIAAKSSNIDEARKLISGVEGKVRDLLGDHIFAVDEETMETNVGKLLTERNVTVSVHEDLTGGMLSERVQMATHKLFIRGVVSSGSQSIRQILSCLHSQEDIDSILADPVLLTDELASAVRIGSRSDYGMALHAYSDPLEKAENLGAGETYISVTDGSKYRRRMYSYGGRGTPDRIRMSLNALELLRSVLITGFKTD